MYTEPRGYVHHETQLIALPSDSDCCESDRVQAGVDERFPSHARKMEPPCFIEALQLCLESGSQDRSSASPGWSTVSSLSRASLSKTIPSSHKHQ